MIVHPHQGVERIRFGMSREDVERAMGLVPERFKRGKYGPEEDLYEEEQARMVAAGLIPEGSASTGSRSASGGRLTEIVT